MASTADFRNGLVIEHNKDLWSIVEFQHVKPGKGAAFVRTKLKNLKTGRVLENTFPAGVKINIERVERREYQFLYADGDDYHFMNNETFEQTFLDKNFISASKRFPCQNFSNCFANYLIPLTRQSAAMRTSPANENNRQLQH